jgi:hypothetical protein
MKSRPVYGRSSEAVSPQQHEQHILKLPLMTVEDGQEQCSSNLLRVDVSGFILFTEVIY